MRRLDAVLLRLRELFHRDVTIYDCDDGLDVGVERWGTRRWVLLPSERVWQVALELAAVPLDGIGFELRISHGGGLSEELFFPSWALPKARRLLAVRALRQAREETARVRIAELLEHSGADYVAADRLKYGRARRMGRGGTWQVGVIVDGEVVWTMAPTELGARLDALSPAGSHAD